MIPSIQDMKLSREWTQTLIRWYPRPSTAPAIVRSAVQEFVHGCLDNMEQPASLFGCLIGAETFNISFYSDYVDDVENGVFVLTCFRLKDTVKLELLEYGCDGKDDVDGDEGLIKELCNCIERSFESCESATD